MLKLKELIVKQNVYIYIPAHCVNILHYMANVAAYRTLQVALNTSILRREKAAGKLKSAVFLF